MKNNSRKIFVFDVDGVIVDSTEECLVIAWNAYQSYKGKDNFINSPEEAKEEYARHFRSIRNYVRSMDEYLVVFNSKVGEIISQNLFEKKIESLDPEDKKRYGEFFYNAREKFKNRDRIRWIKLHQFYPGIERIIQKIGICHLIYVVTGKDKESVLDFFEILEIKIPSSCIYDRDAAKNKLTALIKIAKKEKRSHQEIYFIDDNITHLIKPLNAGFRVFLASWGYGLPEHFILAKELGVPIVSFDDLNQLNSILKV